jgi:hypothetical protein
VRDLHAALTDRDHPEALEAARSLIEKVVVYPPETDNDPPRVVLVGDLIALLQAGGVSSPQSGAQSVAPDGVLSMFVSSIKEAPGAKPWSSLFNRPRFPLSRPA